MRVFNYLIIITGILLLLNIGGIETTSKHLIDSATGLVNDPSGFSLYNLYDLALTAVAGIAVAGIVIGLYFKSSPESFILVGYAAGLLVYVADIIGLITEMNKFCPVDTASGCWASNLVLLLLGGLAVGYVHSVLSWWGGKA